MGNKRVLFFEVNVENAEFSFEGIGNVVCKESDVMNKQCITCLARNKGV